MQLRDTSMAMSSVLDIPFRIKDEAPYKVLCNVTVPQSVLFPQGSARVFGNGPMQTLRIQPAEGKTGVEDIIVGATDEWDATSTVRIRVTVGSTTSVEELHGRAQKMHAWVDGATLHVSMPEGQAGTMNCDLFSASSSEIVQSTSQTVTASSFVVSLPIDGLTSGVYMVRMQRGSSVLTEKIVICR
ncbi:MAG: T9SS C-terminal target domain-containing protein [Chloroflexi bacterium]|nr:T9SS C-terminal target domain-containing protein [Chloroflexota bacterium]